MTHQAPKRCFVAIPFERELNFFYLFVKRFLEERYSLVVERGDAETLTGPLMDKVRRQINRADLVIADVTAGNPNVLYEVGLAHAAGKPVLFLTQDSPEKAPVDIRLFEFIVYDLARHEDFLAKLDSAIRSHFREKYDALYERALDILQQFNASQGTGFSPHERIDFQALSR